MFSLKDNQIKLTVATLAISLSSFQFTTNREEFTADLNKGEDSNKVSLSNTSLDYGDYKSQYSWENPPTRDLGYGVKKTFPSLNSRELKWKRRKDKRREKFYRKAQQELIKRNISSIMLKSKIKNK